VEFSVKGIIYLLPSSSLLDIGNMLPSMRDFVKEKINAPFQLYCPIVQLSAGHSVDLQQKETHSNVSAGLNLI
jgi:hypothetical protein